MFSMILNSNAFTFLLVFILHLIFFVPVVQRAKKENWFAIFLALFPALVVLTYQLSQQDAFRGLAAAAVIFALVFSGAAAIGTWFVVLAQTELRKPGIAANFFADMFGRLFWLALVPFVSCVLCVFAYFAFPWASSKIDFMDEALPEAVASQVPPESGAADIRWFAPPKSYPVFLSARMNQIPAFWLVIGLGVGAVIWGILASDVRLLSIGILLLAVAGYGGLKLVPKNRSIVLTEDGIDMPKFPWGRYFQRYGDIEKVAVANVGYGVAKFEFYLREGVRPDYVEMPGNFVDNPVDLAKFIEQRAAECRGAVADIPVAPLALPGWQYIYDPYAVGLLVAYNVLVLGFSAITIGIGAFVVALILVFIQGVAFAIVSMQESPTRQRNGVWVTVGLLYLFAFRMML